VGNFCIGRQYSQRFVSGVQPGSQQCDAWNTLRASINPSRTYSRVTIRGSADTTGVTCNGPTANTLCQALRTGDPVASVACNGRNWMVGNCGGVEISANGDMCACTSGYVARPCLNNGNFGGVNGPTCNGAAQAIEVYCE
jgi:hypothetical protein